MQQQTGTCKIEDQETQLLVKPFANACPPEHQHCVTLERRGPQLALGIFSKPLLVFE